MSNATTGQLLRKRRESRGLSQRKVEQLTGIPQYLLSRFENNKRPPTQKEWDLLRHLLGLPARAPEPPKARPRPSPCWKVPAPALSSAGMKAFSARAFRARQSFSRQWERAFAVVRSRADASLSLRFLNDAALDSGHEAMFWVLALAEGGKACWYAPCRAGFRKFVIVDRSEKRRVASDVRHPCLEIVRDDYKLLLFPQMRVLRRSSLYILDALACVRSGPRRLWANVEIDGGGHDGEFDHLRQEHLGLPTLRLRKADLAAPQALRNVEKRLLELLEKKTLRAG